MEFPIITNIFPNLNLTKFGKTANNKIAEKENLIGISKVDTKTSVTTSNLIHLNSKITEKQDFKTKFYILNNINNQAEIKSSGGVEAFNNYFFHYLISCTIWLSISPSQGDDPGFKSRPEHLIEKGNDF